MVTIYRKNTCQMIGDNGNGDILLTWIRTCSSLYKLQMKAKLMDEEISCAYTDSNNKSNIHQPAETTEYNKQGNYHYTKQPQKDNIDVWHAQFCHITTNTLWQTAKAIHGMKIQDKKIDNILCEECVLGKQQRNIYPTVYEKKRDTTSSTYFHIDLCGPMSTISLGGASYFMLCKDNNISYMVIIFLKAKSEALTYFKQLYSMIKQELKVDIQRIKTDQGEEFKNHQF